MSVVYLRLPHYVVSYLKNVDAEAPLPDGRPLIIERSDPLYPQVSFLCEPNARNAVHLDCFSQKQWESMQKGKYLVMPPDGTFRMDLQRAYRTPLTLSEVFLLSGHEERVKRDPDTLELEPDTEYIDAYLPVMLPPHIIRDGREQKVYPDWVIPNITVIRNEFIDRFKMALARFLALDRERAHTLRFTRSKMDAIDRFMLRYDIRPSNRVREQMKKMMQRSEMAMRMSFDSDVDHGRWTGETLPDPAPLNPGRQPCPVLCRTTGRVYPSIGAFARENGIPANKARSALCRGFRCCGLEIERLND